MCAIEIPHGFAVPCYAEREVGQMIARTGRRIVRIDGATLTGTRPRPAGANARLGPHGTAVTVPIVRLTLDDGTTGFGRSRANPSVSQRANSAPANAPATPVTRPGRP
ncbi:MAG: hypothetical protein EB020_15090 [Proteobacteria bacterium]|nr:hypothetical protein [Pseudomonadota bacterium]